MCLFRFSDPELARALYHQTAYQMGVVGIAQGPATAAIAHVSERTSEGTATDPPADERIPQPVTARSA